MLVRHRLQGLAVLTLFPGVFLAFLSPWIAVWSAWFTAALRGMGVSGLPDLMHLVALFGAVAVFVVWKISLAGSFAYLADPAVRGGRLALRRGWERWLPVALTELLISVIVAASMIPAVVVSFMSFAPRIFGKAPAFLGPDPSAVLPGIFILAISLGLPMFLSVRYVFAPLVVAAGGQAGPAALAASEVVVRGNFWLILRFLILWVVVQFALTVVFAPLPMLQWLVPLALVVFGRAYLVALYRAFQKA